MYKLTINEFVTRLSDGASIPPDPANSDYAAYLQWLNGWAETIRAPGTRTPEVPATFDAEGNELTPSIPGYWTEGAVLETIVHEPHTPEPYVPPPVDVQALILDTTQKRLDNFAQQRKYDSILSACTYATSTIPKFQQEGQYAVDARDQTWAALYTLLEEVTNGTKPLPTSFEDVEPLLPTLAWPT